MHTLLFLSIATPHLIFLFFFFNDTATTEIYTLSLHDALPISPLELVVNNAKPGNPTYVEFQVRPIDLNHLWYAFNVLDRSEEHTSELQSLRHLVCRLLLEKKKKNKGQTHARIKSCTYCTYSLQ